MHFFLNNSFHSGDVIISRPIIIAVKEKYPDVKITLECQDYNVYLWEDLGLPVLTCGGGYPTESPTPNCPPNALFFNLWLGLYQDIFKEHDITYKNGVHSFNRQLKRYHLNHLFQLAVPELPPAIEFYRQPAIPFQVGENGILVENGPARSGQSSFPMNDYLADIAKVFPHFTFYCSARPLADAPNLVDCSPLNLIQLSEISNQCKALLTMGSGVNAATYTEANRFKPRCLAGMIYRGTIWNNAQTVYVQDINGILDFLYRISDGKWAKIKQLI